MSLPNFDKETWPKTPTGNTDWEVLFEQPKDGFLPYIESAENPVELRGRALKIIGTLYTRKDDTDEIERLSGEIYELIPDELAGKHVPVVARAVVQALREIKAYRIKKAHEFDLQKLTGAAKDDRRSETTTLQSLKKAINNRKLRQNLLIGMIAAGIIFIGLSTYFAVPLIDKPEDGELAYNLILEMEYAATGGAVNGKAYGVHLRSENKLGNIAVVAAGVPRASCIDTAWGLRQKGQLFINSLSPDGKSRAAMEKICAESSGKLTFRWVPDKQ
ncbi:MAG: hypothetical protein HQ503_01675 [Rhodospirillales bacterium]|nr:hypothetical protein [Rhodospirillales bacterium]